MRRAASSLETNIMMHTLCSWINQIVSLTISSVCTSNTTAENPAYVSLQSLQLQLLNLQYIRSD